MSFTHFLNKDSLSTYWGHNTSFPLLASHLSSLCFQQTVSRVKHHSRPWGYKGDRAKFSEFTLLEGVAVQNEKVLEREFPFLVKYWRESFE